jgi:hypothetical protein
MDETRYIELVHLQDELARTQLELEQARAETHAAFQHCACLLEEASTGNARVIYALDRGVQLIELLIAFLPEGQPAHPGLEAARGAFEQALRDIRK